MHKLQWPVNRTTNCPSNSLDPMKYSNTLARFPTGWSFPRSIGAACLPAQAIRPLDQVITSNLSFDFLADDCFLVQPLQVLNMRSIHHDSGWIPQVQVSWTGLPLSLCTWQSEAALSHKFHQAPAWGQEAFQGGGPAMTLAPCYYQRCDRRWARERQLRAQEEKAQPMK
jgi:hypothetical protein